MPQRCRLQARRFGADIRRAVRPRVRAANGHRPATAYGRDFWIEFGRTYSKPHYRLEKSARIINRLARNRGRCTLLDIGCGPATLQHLLASNITYYGIDMAIQEPAPNLVESDFLKTPIRFEDMKFDIISVQGVFEYLGGHQAQKLAEIAGLFNQDGVALLTYVNFGHRKPDICEPYSNVQSINDFSNNVNQHLSVKKLFPTSYNWNHWEPGRALLRAANMPLQVNIPLLSRPLAVEYFFICSSRGLARPDGGLAGLSQESLPTVELARRAGQPLLRSRASRACCGTRAQLWRRDGAATALSSRPRPLNRIANNAVSAAAQLIDHLLTTVDRVDVHVTDAVGSIVEMDPPHVTEPARYYHGPDSRGLLRSRCEPRERQADAQFMVADVESGERPATGPAADERLDGEGPELVRTTDREVLGLVFHF
jgi:SAM-dependent methyltransferase